jgi:hypothetical protein
MKTNYLKILSAVVLSLFVLSASVQAIGVGEEPLLATEVKQDEAAKKYPPPKGGYPAGERELRNPGIIKSPYPPHQRYDCRKIGRGGLVLDSRNNRVFVKP